MSDAADPSAKEPSKSPGSANGTAQLDFEIEFFGQVLERAPDYVDVLRCQAELLARKGLHQRAIVLDQRLIGLRPHDPIARYNFACDLANCQQISDSIEQLRASFELGYDDLDHFFADPDLDVLRAAPEYQSLLRDFGIAEAEVAEG